MRYALYLIGCILVELTALPIAFIGPLFKVSKYGLLDNGNKMGGGYRLPNWLNYYNTPDNSLYGDSGWRTEHCPKYKSYWGMVKWLLRNRAYQFKWSVIAAPMDRFKLLFEGDPTINRNNGRYGIFKAKMGDYWQWKMVKPIGKTGYAYMFNFGWLLDDMSQEKALFMFSPRFVKLHRG